MLNTDIGQCDLLFVFDINLRVCHRVRNAVGCIKLITLMLCRYMMLIITISLNF